MSNIKHKVLVCGLPGTGKSTLGLSYPGVEQHVFGSSEEDTALGFSGRSDILPPVKLDWYDCLKDDEKEKFTSESVSEEQVAMLQKRARARNIAKYRRYLYKLKDELKSGKSEVKTVFMDNFTPFSQEFEDYVEVVWAQELTTKQGNFDQIAFYKKYQSELTDFMRMIISLPCHVVVSSHISMVAAEEISANTQFIKAASMGGVKKEWQPMVTGKAKFALAGLFTWAFYMWCEEMPGQRTKYLAKLEADDANVGIAKSRFQPFEKPNKIQIPKGEFYQFLEEALNKQQGQVPEKGGK